MIGKYGQRRASCPKMVLEKIKAIHPNPRVPHYVLRKEGKDLWQTFNGIRQSKSFGARDAAIAYVCNSELERDLLKKKVFWR